MAPSKIASFKTSEVAIDMPKGQEDACKELENIFGYEAQAGTSSAGAKTRPKIQKIPQIMRENEKNMINYDPKLVSIGPYHYGNPKLKEGQALKTRIVQEFSSYLQDIPGKKKSLKAYFHSEEFGKVVSEAKNCYAMIPKELSTDEAFKCLMFLDGCFVVYFIHCVVNNKWKDVQMKNHHKAIITMDLFLLENQLPYTVLQALVNEFMPPEKNKDIAEFINMQTDARGSKGRETELYRLFNWCCNKKDNTPKSEGSSSSSRKTEPLHLLDYLRTEFLITASSPPSDQSGKKNQGKMEWQTFRSVEELKAAGIHCKTSGSSSVKEIKFKRYKLKYASLSLPAIVIDDFFKTKWLNMLAYEACTDFINDGDITSFICFMDSLIDRPEDVKELRQKGVLQNSLGSDEHVAHLFNELATDLTPNPDQYRQVKHDIQKHFDKTWAVWFAEVLHTHFSSPWTVLAFVAAVLILFLTVVQTYLTAFPKGNK